MEQLNFPVNVAVYGTLRSGYGNHALIENSSLVGVGKTKEQFTLTASGIPFVTKGLNEGLSNVTVEVYSVETESDLRNLDGLEGHPNWYRRELTTIVLEDDSEVEAWLYFNEPGGSIIASGDYADYRRKRESVHSW